MKTALTVIGKIVEAFCIIIAVVCLFYNKTDDAIYFMVSAIYLNITSKIK